jgi:hypothetical protein
VLLVDDFDRLIVHPNFATPSFWSRLRSLSEQFKGLMLVTTSQLPATEMDRLILGVDPHHTAFFYNLSEIELGPLGDGAISTLFDTALTGTGIVFGPRDRDLVRALAGRHPLLLQTAASALYDAITVNKNANQQTHYRPAMDSFYRQVSSFLSDLWHDLAPHAQTALVLRCLDEVHNRILGTETDFGTTAEPDHYRDTVNSLVDRGIVEWIDRDIQHVDQKRGTAHNGQRWRIAGLGWMWWIIDQIVLQDDVDRLPTLTAGQDFSKPHRQIDALRQWSGTTREDTADRAARIGELLLQDWLTVR